MERPLRPAFVRHSRIAMAKVQGLSVRIDLYAVTFFELACENLDCEGVLNQPLNGSLQRASPVHRIVTFLRDERLGSVSNLEGKLSARQILAQTFQLDFHDGLDFLPSKVVENDRLIDAVQKFRFERIAQGRGDKAFHLLSISHRQILDVLATKI